jgi:hypothetical protein
MTLCYDLLQSCAPGSLSLRPHQTLTIKLQLIPAFSLLLCLAHLVALSAAVVWVSAYHESTINDVNSIK